MLHEAKPMKNKADCYEYVRNYYNVPAYVGVRVTSFDREQLTGVIVAAKSDLHYVHVRFDGKKHAVNVHPLDLEYETGNQANSGTCG
jgi:hypothetical protein